MKLPIEKIRTDGGTNPRVALSDAIVNEYAEEIQRGAVFPPLAVFYDGVSYWLADGFHRHGAAVRLRMYEIECDVRQGTLGDARWHSCGANRSHGMRRTNEDKARAVRAALKHSPRLGDTEIARHVGVSHQMVSKYRAEMDAVSSASRAMPAALPSKPRVVTRNGTTYIMRTVDIGRRFSKPTKTIAVPAPVAEPYTYTVHLPPGNPLGAAMVLVSRCSRAYLEDLVQELRNLLSSGQTH